MWTLPRCHHHHHCHHCHRHRWRQHFCRCFSVIPCFVILVAVCFVCVIGIVFGSFFDFVPLLGLLMLISLPFFEYLCVCFTIRIFAACLCASVVIYLLCQMAVDGFCLFLFMFNTTACAHPIFFSLLSNCTVCCDIGSNLFAAICITANSFSLLCRLICVKKPSNECLKSIFFSYYVRSIPQY